MDNLWITIINMKKKISYAEMRAKKVKKRLLNSYDLSYNKSIIKK